MIAQWENECISLSVLSVAWVMIAQWENECISLRSSLSVLTVGPPCGPTMAEYFTGFSLADHVRCLVHSSGNTKEQSGAPLEIKLCGVWFLALIVFIFIRFR